MEKKNYTIKMKLQSQNPKTVGKLIGGTGILDMLKNIMGNLSPMNSMPESPFHDLENDDIDASDPVGAKLLNMGGPKHVVKIFRMQSPEDMHHAMKHLANTLSETRNAYIRKELRHLFASINCALGNENDAFTMERIASKLPKKSPGLWQAESIATVERLMKVANVQEYDALVEIDKMLSNGGYAHVANASKIAKNMYEAISTPRNTRIAYTTLATTDGEPILMCPKGKVEFGSAVPMEASKCRWNCIDSRLDVDGNVRCNYESWMKQSFQSHDVVMGRLDTTRHPDNEANLLNIKDGERKTHEDEIGYEKMFEDSDLKAAKLRKDKPNTDDSMEKQLADLPAVGYGHTVDDKKLNKRTAQSDHSKTIEDQLPRKGEQKKSLFDLLVSKYNTKVNLDEKIEVNLEDNAGLYDRKGEEDKSTIEKINEMKKNPINVSEEINEDAGDGDDKSLPDHLNKTASKDEKSFDNMLEDKRTNKKLDKTIEEMLEDDAENWGHQFSDDDLKEFAKHLGLDYILEESREED